MHLRTNRSVYILHKASLPICVCYVLMDVSFPFQLPYLQEKDSFVRYYGLKKKQVVKITYSKEPVGDFVTYRCII